MKNYLYFILSIIIIPFSIHSKEDIGNFQIEEFSIGENLSDYFTKEEIKNFRDNQSRGKKVFENLATR